MKRISSLFTICTSLLVFFSQASWAADSYETSYIMQAGETHTAGSSVSVSGNENGQIVATLTFGFEGDAAFTAAKSDNSVDGFKAYTAGNGVNGGPDSGTTYIINTVYSGSVTVGVMLNAGKSFYVLEDNQALSSYNGITVDSKTCGTYAFPVKAGSTYKVYCTGSKLGFYGFSYTYSLDNDTPIVTYQLKTGVTPSDAGYVRPSGTRSLVSGSVVSMSTYRNNSNYSFKHWLANGEMVSTSSSFDFTMPAQDTELLAVYEYDPSNPPNPNMPDQTKKYTLRLTTQPANAGSFNRNSGEQYAAGESLYMYYNNKNGFKFDYWMSGDSIVSYDRYFYFTMPEHDAELTAVYHFDPSSPANPDTAEVRYTVTLETKPANAGSFNWNSTTAVVAGRSCDVYAYNNTGFVFREWQQNGETVGTDRNYRFQMPAESIRLTAVYDFNPSNPQNPGKNYWNAETGEVIVDDFTSGYLYDAVYQTTGGNYDQVQMITVAGPISQYDWGIVNNYGNCTFLDMSRTYGLTYVPSYNFSGNTTLTTVVLPAGIERIEYYAFRGCSNLSSISIYAATPPTIGSRAFEGIGDSIVYVPADALALYQEAEGWKDFTILPIANQVSALEVNLPEGTDPSIYKDMYIELINAKSGQKQRYVITNRTTYTFNSLIHRTSYNVYLKNAQGDVLGEVDGIDIVDHDVSVTFESLMVPRDLTLQVLTPEGLDVTGQTTITWMDAKNTYLTKGNTLTGQLEGAKAKFRITLPQSLGMQYLLPADSLYEVQTDNNISYTLTAIPQKTISGAVLDVKTEQPISGATIAISQMLNGLYSKSFTTKTDNKGEWSLLAYEAKTDITASMPDYVSKSQSFESLVAEIPVFELKDINGTTISLNLTYTTVDGETQSYYNDYTNVAYSIYNKTAEQQVTQMNVQYPQIVLMESLAEGTELVVTATSKNSKFVPVTATATVDSLDRANVTLPIVQLGGIIASFKQTDNNSIVGILYDSNNRLIKRYDYNGASLTISELNDGAYTLVTMANSQFFNSVATISQFAEAGLREGVDYVKNSVTVKSGAYTAINNQMIPFLDETKLYYTGENTSIVVNKSQITVGNYLTISGRLDFKNAYADAVSDVKLIVNLPEETSFVDNSVMVGSSTASYTYDNHKLIVPLANYSDRVRFCFIPTVGGIYSPTASVQFTMAGKEITQPIGNVNFTAKDLSINIPSTIANTTIPISGTAVSKSMIEIYDNDVLIGQTTALANGTWSAKCELNEPYNMSRHNIYAKAKTTQGLELNSETEQCIYDKNYIQISKVHMLYNGYDLIFDYLHPSSNSGYYSFVPSYPDFTFTIEFTDNDTTKVSDVIVYVKTSNNSWIPLEASFNDKKQYWVASGKFNSSGLPVNVSVGYKESSLSQIDYNRLNEPFELHQSIQKVFAYEDDLIESIFSSKDQESIDSYMESIGYSDEYWMQYVDVNTLSSLLDSMTDAEKEKYIESFFIELEENDTINAKLKCLRDNFIYDENWEEIVLDGAIYRRNACDNIDSLSLVAEGFDVYLSDNNSIIYIRSNDNGFDWIDTKDHIKYSCIYANSSAQQVVKRTSKNNALTAEDLREWTKSINDKLDYVKGLFDRLKKTLDDVLEPLVKEQARLGREKGRLTILKKKCNPAMLHIYNQQIQDLDKKLALLRNGIRAVKKVTEAVAKYMPIAKYALVASDATIDLNKLYNVYRSIPDPCEEDQSNATEYQWDVAQKAGYTFSYYMFYLGFDVSMTINNITQAAAGLATGGSTLATAIVGELAKMGAETLANYIKDKTLAYYIDEMNKKINKLECKKRPCKGGNCPPPPGDEDGGHHSNNPDQRFGIDPSGYVYEGVSSNRLQGVTATAYYKETVEDMYGDLHENVVLWNAEEYAQKNPLFTDEYGMYQWDVPQGLWQVKFEKEGYQTTYSEWLPVPPPQLEVNIPMTQMLQPTVKSVKAFDEGMDIEFDKYMDPATLTTENIAVMRNGNVAEGVITLLNEEPVTTGSKTTYASRIRFQVPEGQELLSTDEVQLTVRRSVNSYAGVPMEEDYTQSFNVEPKVHSIAADELVNVKYGDTRTITIGALPTDAAKGKKLYVKSLSEMIATITADNLNTDEDGQTWLTLDENGQVELTISGELPGSTVLNYSVEESDVTGITTVNVKEASLMETAAPRASRVSGTQVYRGTQITLSSETAGATIYYTLDGSCPCNTETAIKYDSEQPIVIADDVVTIKAMAMAKDLEDSPVVEFTYRVKTTQVGLDLAEGWTWISHNVEGGQPVSILGNKVEVVRSQTEESIAIPGLEGVFGPLETMQPAVLYKVKMKTTDSNTLSGYEFNAHENAVQIVSGWNWIGYPINQVMTLDEALAFFQPSEGDYIVGQDGFAEYADGDWQGTLTSFRPGYGYLYKSAVDTEISFNTTIVSNAVNSEAPRLIINVCPWASDKHGYSNIMPVTANLYNNGKIVSENDFVVAAFAGTECRGVAKWKNGRLLMGVGGDKAEDITFMAFDPTTKNVYQIEESVRFNASNVGNWLDPFVLSLGRESLGIDALYSDIAVTPLVANDHIKVSASGRHISRVTLTNMGGSTVLVVNDIGQGGVITIGSLPAGIYIVTVQAEGKSFYQRIVKTDK